MIRSSRRTVALAGIAALFLLLTIGVPNLPPPRVELPVTVEGVVPSGGQAAACIGYNTERDSWGVEWEYCPANHVMYGVDDPAGVKGPASKINAVHACCPLPSKDILGEQHVYVTEECPIDHVATGSKHEGSGDEARHWLRCTKINTERYVLGENLPAVYWGDGAAGWQGSTRIHWKNIPAGIRYASGRLQKDKWDIDGCVGYPWGSMLAKKSGKYCSELYFRQLRFSGLPGDPPRGTPVKMFAECDDVQHVDQPEGFRCKKG